MPPCRWCTASRRVRGSERGHRATARRGDGARRSRLARRRGGRCPRRGGSELARPSVAASPKAVLAQGSADRAGGARLHGSRAAMARPGRVPCRRELRPQAIPPVAGRSPSLAGGRYFRHSSCRPGTAWLRRLSRGAVPPRASTGRHIRSAASHRCPLLFRAPTPLRCTSMRPGRIQAAPPPRQGPTAARARPPVLVRRRRL
mmetsp:Transcript_52229/g.168331  ORF Transcript_52229/g.168331 Transcript_52229/m.168331 type:complete len:202 (+) Transcript_52229:366-971(+)